MKAFYHSVWDMCFDVRSNCQVNVKTGEISEIETNIINSGDSTLTRQYLELLDGQEFEVEENEEGNLIAPEIKKTFFVRGSYEISEPMLKKAEQALVDNGIEKDEAYVVLQALGYILLDEEFYPD